MKEHEIRPEGLLERYVELSALDAKTCFGNDLREFIPCVACGSGNCIHSFSKNGFAFAQCSECASLYQNPRPPLARFEAFYRESESSRFWAETFFPAVAEIRREKIFRPRVERLHQFCEDRRIEVGRLVDVGAGFGIFLDEWRKRSPTTHMLAIEPSSSLAAACRLKGLTVVENIVENVRDQDDAADLVTCFEVLEHVYSPLYFLQTLVTLARPGGYVFISTLGIDGFDLQVMWEKSSQISPPHHINFLSVHGFETLFQRAGLVDISVTTPGQLDVDIVRNASRRDSQLLSDQRFLQNLIQDEKSARAFQEFLVSQRKSSHVWVIGRKPTTAEINGR